MFTNRLAALVGDLELAGRAEDQAQMEAVWPDVEAELVRVDAFLQER